MHHYDHKDEDPGKGKIPPPSTIFGHFKLFLWNTSNHLIYTRETLDEIAYPLGRSVLSERAVGIYGISKRVVLFGVFIYLLISNFITLAITQRFVALSPDAGNCLEIPKPWTISSILADRNGYWSGQPGFQSNEACYQFSLFNFESTTENYKTWLKTIDDAITSVGNLAKTQDLATNLLYWSSWSFSSSTDTDSGPVDQTVILAGNPRYIMNNEGIQGTIANISSDCDFSASSQSYDVATGTISSIFDMASVKNFPKCNGIINAAELGWNPLVTGDTFTISIDVVALYTALAVAEQVNGPSTLDRYVTFSEVSKAVWGDVEYSIVDKYDPGYPGMAPITCVGPSNQGADQWNCLLRVGSSYGIPYLVHRGANKTYPEACDCASNGASSSCDDFNLLLGLIVFDHKSQPKLIEGYPEAFQPIIPFLEVFYVPPLFPAKSANRYSFYPAFAAMFGQSSTIMQSAAWRSDKYAYTSTNFGTGAIIVINSFSNIQSGVTADNLQLQDGACADQITTVNFNNFYSNSWGPLVETYYQCTMSFSDAILNAAGIASGTAGLLVPVGLLFIMYVCMGYGALKMIQNNPNTSSAEVEIIVDNDEASSSVKREMVSKSLSSLKKENTAVAEVYPDRYEELSLVDLDNYSQASVATGNWIPGLGLIGLGSSSTSPNSSGSATSEFSQFQARRRKALMSDRRFNSMSQAELSTLIVDEYNATKKKKKRFSGPLVLLSPKLTS